MLLIYLLFSRLYCVITIKLTSLTTGNTGCRRMPLDNLLQSRLHRGIYSTISKLPFQVHRYVTDSWVCWDKVPFVRKGIPQFQNSRDDRILQFDSERWWRTEVTTKFVMPMRPQKICNIKEMSRLSTLLKDCMVYYSFLTGTLFKIRQPL